jgi:hypothetical protein
VHVLDCRGDLIEVELGLRLVEAGLLDYLVEELAPLRQLQNLCTKEICVYPQPNYYLPEQADSRALQIYAGPYLIQKNFLFSIHFCSFFLLCHYGIPPPLTAGRFIRF